MKPYNLTKVFLSVYKNLLNSFHVTKKAPINLNIQNPDDFEKKLEDFMIQMMGYITFAEYQNYKNGNLDRFDYFGELKKYFESLIINATKNNLINIEQWVDKYIHIYEEELDNHPNVNLFIEAAKKCLSDNQAETYVVKDGNKYTIGKLDQKQKEGMPKIIINDIDNFEYILESFIMSLYKKDNYYGLPLHDLSMSTDEAKEFIFEWVLKNATVLDLEAIENYYYRYINFILDNTLDEYKKVTKIGEVFDDELYLGVKKADVAYETPFYLSFMLKNKRLELPTIRMGIEETEKGKIAHILATQSSQLEFSKISERDFNKTLNKELVKSKYYREYNPSHIVSLVLTLGILKSLDINYIRIPNYLPLRYQKLVNEHRKNEEEINNYQHRLTNKFTNNFFRLSEMCDGLEVSSYPDGANVTDFKINDNITFANDFLTNLFNIGYQINKNDEKSKNNR